MLDDSASFMLMTLVMMLFGPFIVVQLAKVSKENSFTSNVVLKVMFLVSYVNSANTMYWFVNGSMYPKEQFSIPKAY